MASNDDKAAWNLVTDGTLWKKVSWYANAEFKKHADTFVAKLQESMPPTDILQGLLLDRIAAGLLRKQLLLDVQGATAQYDSRVMARNNSNDSSGLLSLAAEHHLGRSWSANLLKYESLLDQGFHRDLILLLALKKAAPALPASSAKKPPQSDRRLIGDQVSSIAAELAIGSSATVNPSPIAPESQVKQSGRDDRWLHRPRLMLSSALGNLQFRSSRGTHSLSLSACILTSSPCTFFTS